MAGPNLTRELKIKEILDRIQAGGDTQGAASDLEKMFSQVESDAEKIRSAGQTDRKKDHDPDVHGRVKDVNVNIRTTYQSVTKAISDAGNMTVETLGNIFGSYSNLLKYNLNQTVNAIPQLNIMMSKTGDKAFKTFNDFKGMSLTASEDIASMHSRVAQDLIKTMHPSEMKKYLMDFYNATQENFQRIKLLGPETEAQYVKLGAALERYQIKARDSARYMQNLNILGDGPDKFAAHFDQVQRIANATNQPVSKLMEYYDNLRMKQGYTHKQAINNLAELSVRSMETGLTIDHLGESFGKNMDAFTDLVPKIATLNATFRLRLNPAAMTRMTAEQRQRYITNSLKKSGVDLNNRLLQRQVAGLLGSEVAARKFLASIANQSKEVAKGVTAATKATRAIAREEMDGKAATAKLLRDGKTQLDILKQQELTETEIAYKAQVQRAALDAGLARGKGKGVSAAETKEDFEKRLFEYGVQRVEREATATRMLVAEFKRSISTEFGAGKELTGVFKTAVIRFQRAQAIIGGKVGTVMGAVEALSGGAGDFGEGLAKKAREKLGDETSGLVKEQREIAEKLKAKDLKQSDIVKLKARSTEIAGQILDLKAYIKSAEKLKSEKSLSPSAATIKGLKASKAKLEARNDAVEKTGRETATEQGKRIGKSAVSAGETAWSAAKTTWSSASKKIDNLVEAIKKARPIVVNLDGVQIADAVAGVWSGDIPTGVNKR